MLQYAPAVFAVGKEYQIMVPVTAPSLFWVEVDGKCYYDAQNGILRSLRPIHRVCIPMEVLDRAGKYTVCEREIIDRKPYFPLTQPERRTEFSFFPLPKDEIRIFHIADAHDHTDAPVRAARAFGKIDLLILNGDIPNHSGEISNFHTIYALADEITHGNIPVIFSRGNHDLRGYHAEEIADYTPSWDGKTYFSVRLGSLWAVILDCGEDKEDSHAEYGYTVACHPFREAETEFLQKLARDPGSEWAAEGVEHRFLISHMPFTYRDRPPFDIEQNVYAEWARLVTEHVHPELFLCGHLHRLAVAEPGGEMDHLGQPCTMVIGSAPRENGFTGCGIILARGKKPQMIFCDSEAGCLPDEQVPFFPPKEKASLQ